MVGHVLNLGNSYMITIDSFLYKTFCVIIYLIARGIIIESIELYNNRFLYFN